MVSQNQKRTNTDYYLDYLEHISVDMISSAITEHHDSHAESPRQMNNKQKPISSASPQ